MESADGGAEPGLPKVVPEDAKVEAIDESEESKGEAAAKPEESEGEGAGETEETKGEAAIKPEESEGEGAAESEEAKVEPTITVNKIPSALEAEGDVEKYKDAKLIAIKIASPKEPAYDGVRAQAGSICYIIDPSRPQDDLPMRLDPCDGAFAREKQVLLTAEFVRLMWAPGITVNYEIKRGTKSPSGTYDKLHNGSVTWLFKPVSNHKGKETFTCIKPRTFQAQWTQPSPDPSAQPDDPPPADYLAVTFTSTHVVAEVITLPTDFELSDQERAITTLLASYLEFGEKQVSLKLCPYAHQVDKINTNAEGGMTKTQRILEQLFGERQTAAFKRPANFNAYRRVGANKQKPGVQFGSMKSRMSVLKGGTTFIAQPYTSQLIDGSHAELVLGYGMMIEAEEQTQAIMAIANDEHTATVHRFHDHIIVGVKFKLDKRPNAGLGSDRFSLPVSTKVDLAIQSTLATDGVIAATSVTMDQEIDISPSADIQVMLVRGEARKVQVLGKHGSRPKNNSRHVVVTVTPDLSDRASSSDVS